MDEGWYLGGFSRSSFGQDEDDLVLSDEGCDLMAELIDGEFFSCCTVLTHSSCRH